MGRKLKDDGIGRLPDVRSQKPVCLIQKIMKPTEKVEQLYKQLKPHISPSVGMACGLLEQIYAPSPPASKVPRKDLSS